MGSVKTILVPTDFSETAEAAVEAAFDLAQKFGARVHLLHVYGLPAQPDAMVMGIDLLGPILESVNKALARVTARYEKRLEFADAAREMGDPREVILRYAKELPADLIVMGTHGRSGLQRLILGSVAERVVRTAPCAVLVVPPAPAPQAS